MADCPAQVWLVPPALMRAMPLTVLAPLRRAQSISDGAIGVDSAVSCRPSWAQPATARISPMNRAASFMGRLLPFQWTGKVDANTRRGPVIVWWFGRGHAAVAVVSTRCVRLVIGSLRRMGGRV